MGGMGGMMGGMGMGQGFSQIQGRFQAAELMNLIQETVGLENWEEYGGKGTINPFGNKKLVVNQTRDVHNEIEKLLTQLRIAQGDQVAIEARFLLVTENFLEDIGLDIDLTRLPQFEVRELEWWEIPPPAEGEEVVLEGFEVVPTGKVSISQRHFEHTTPDITKVAGSLGGLASALELTFGGMILDTLQVDFLLRATQAHRDATSLTAPKATVLSGESASFTVESTVSYALPPDIERQTMAGGVGVGGVGVTGITGQRQNIGYIPTGTVLNITPTITTGKKYVLLNIVAELQEFLGMKSHTVQAPTGLEGEVSTYIVKVPETETSVVRTRVSVPDGGTLLLGGQKVTATVEKESGVPILSKIPGIGRLFSNRSIVKDQKILLILVKPTIILQEESEAEALAAME